ncbi:MAG: PAS domain-containing protein, partial [Candidatus Latescibacteria bacterium]|nr:PAS domain-containing protein [Candidatus Latescibacterota bacterium]
MSGQSKENGGSKKGPRASDRGEPPSSRRESIYRELFDSFPIGIWEEDWSQVKEMIDKLKKRGVTDWHRYFDRRKDLVTQAYELATATHINQAALDIYRAPNEQEVVRISALKMVLPEELSDFKNNLIAFIEGRTSYETESIELDFDGFEITTRRNVTIPPGHQTSWSRVLHSIENITERKRLEMLLRESEARYREIFDDAPMAIWVEDWSPVKKMIDGLAEKDVENLRAYFSDHRDRTVEAYNLVTVLQTSKASLDLFGATTDEDYVGVSRGALVLP